MLEIPLKYNTHKSKLVRNAAADVCNHEDASYPYKLFYLKHFYLESQVFQKKNQGVEFLEKIPWTFSVSLYYFFY